MTCRNCKWAASCIMSAPDGGWEACDKFKERDMDEKDKTINELRLSTRDLLEKIQELQQSLREDWHVLWEELPEDDDVALVLWRETRNGREHHFFELLEYTEEDGWIFSDLMKIYQRGGSEVEVVAWKELPEVRLLTAQLFED